jgi:outer membrane protein assembly factor BamD
MGGMSLLAIALAVMMTGCAGARHHTSLPPADLLARAEHELERGKNRSAQTRFQEFLDRYPSDPAADRAQLGLARSYIGLKEWSVAREELRLLIQRYPDSPEVESARFLTGLAYSRESLPAEMDQELTRKALDEFEAYLADYPEGEYRDQAAALRQDMRAKLARKDLKNGNLYLKMGFPRAARLYYQEVLDRYADTPSAAEARFGLAEALRKLGEESRAAGL